MTPRLLTERLLLRPYERGDRERCVQLFTDPEVMRFVGDGVMSPARAAELFEKVFRVYAQNEFDVWAVCAQDDGGYLGTAELKPRQGTGDLEIVYVLGKAHWGRGYATEVARALVGYGFEALGARRIVATVDPGNAPSMRLLEKIGFRRAGEEVDDAGIVFVYAIDAPRGQGG
ncbi:acetyltransferase [Sorangium cellulosum]|uniref:Acetyltransferase n=1 Tax=Sorangium cellulosum TaxID=56 RepID=A0A2L0ES73_SORCE|nr:GNAT family N-acetyltransferase [Sorangium cellulosum]AUX42146.1 acetyltransferase [Sorangium cellulosum]